MHLVQAIIHHDQESIINNNTNNMTAEMTTNGDDTNLNDENTTTPTEEKDTETPEQAPKKIENTPESPAVSKNSVDESEDNDDEDDDEDEEEESEEDLEAKAIAEATASADKSYTPPVALLNNPSPYPLIRSVDGMSLKKYNPAPSIFTARSVPVPLRGVLNVPIHVTIGGSVVDYTVESKDYDIEFGVVAEREEGTTIVSAKKRVDSQIKAVTGKFLVGTVPCALIFTFDNEYSWFREKRITYQITVRPPTKENIISGRKIRANTALNIITKDKTSAEERLENVSSKRQELVQDIEKLEKELEEKKKTLGVVEKEETWLKNRVQLRSVQENLLNRRLADGWEDENHDEGVEQPAERAEI